MRHRVEFQMMQSATGTMVLRHVYVDATTGDEAAAGGRLAALHFCEDNRGRFRSIVGVFPDPVLGEPDVEAPVAAVEGDDAEMAEADERTALLADARARGVDVDGRWGVVRLRAALAGTQA